ncbi:MAG: VOC family protein [Maricaulaceae bacterium]|jgi:catechol 2,3-dioxygenase-like lactoylglutathione lyase family enzyme
MSAASLEHVNLTVTDPRKTAQMLSDLFGWKIRWEGPAMSGGYTVHVGTEDAYLAVYAPPDSAPAAAESGVTTGGLNHVGVTVDDLDAAEQRVVKAGFEPVNHGDYEPGRRFYFYDADGIEFEVVSYA